MLCVFLKVDNVLSFAGGILALNSSKND